MPSINDSRKSKTLVILLVIISFIMINNFAKRRDFADLDKTVNSIYNDRLMPAGILFNLNNLLHEKHDLLLSANVQSVAGDIEQHNKTIASLIPAYERTYLTPSEKTQWLAFRRELDNYNVTEQRLLSGGAGVQPGVGTAAQLTTNFAGAQAALSRLNSLQVQEGQVLQNHSRSIIGGSVIYSYLDGSLLFIVVIIVLIFADINNRSLRVANQPKSWLN